MKKNIIFLIGAAGCGKSSIGKIICKYYNIMYLDKDIVCNNFTSKLLQLNGYNSGDRDDCAFYKNDLMPIEYKTILDIANDNISLGQSVLLDAPFCAYFNDENYLNKLKTKYNWSNDVNIIVIHIDIDEKLHYTRILERNNERDKWKLDNWQEYILSLEKNKCTWKNAIHLYYNNNNDLPDKLILDKKLHLTHYLF